MNRIRFLATSWAIALMTSPVFAQAPATPDADPDRARRAWEYGYGHMWGGGSPMMWGDRWGWYPGMIIGPIVMVLILVGAIAIVVSLVRWFSHPAHDGRRNFDHGGRSRSALDILEERFARGDIDKSEFEDRRRTLGR